MRSVVMAVLVSAVPAAASAQSADPSGSAKQFAALRVPGGSALRIDGHLDEQAWAGARWRSDFHQKLPVEGAEPTVRTEVAFLYDDDALYVGARMYSNAPSRIPTAVARRDQMTNAEHLVIALDTYHDRRTSYSFVISSGGVRIDYYHAVDNEYSRDMTWDPVWEAKSSVDGTGWVAEARIPLSQLRFAGTGRQRWGVQINRWIPSTHEDIYWVVIPAKESGWASRFGELAGIDGIRPSRRLEVVPYVASNAVFSPATPGDPFNDGSELAARAGADLKMGLGPNMTLDATVNPDFGQVEADPAEVNLSAFETFFDERRPFFTEGAQLLRGGGQNFFYSRRIGQAPRGSATGSFVDRPSNATILGAGKVTGQLRNGFSIGVLTAVTGREEARTFDAGSGTYGRTEIEPLSAYGVGRVQRQFGANGSVAGLSLTAVQRDLGLASPLAGVLPRTAVTGGGDVNIRTANGAYEVAAAGGFSYVTGDEAAILRVQRAAAHFMQRPDATEFTLDSTRTALAGWSASVRGAKNAGRHWLWNAFLGFESPALDLNDVGRIGSADDIDAGGQVRYRETAPTRRFRQWSSTLFLGRSWNFGGVHTGTRWSLVNNFTFQNFWSLSLGTYGNTAAYSDDLTRGGPIMGVPAAYGFDAQMSGNPGRPTSWQGGLSYYNDQVGGWSTTLLGGLSARPGSRWRVSVNPGWTRSVGSRQYVTSLAGGRPETFGTRYIFSYIRRNTLSARLRVNYAFTPEMSVELYAEPFAASGRYYAFGELAAARSHELRTYGENGTTIDAQPDGSQLVSADGRSFTIEPRDFSVLSFRSNLVLRWEWLRGSTVFVVWQQDRSGPAVAGRPVRVGSLLNSFGAAGRNYVAVKATYWISAR